MKIEMMLTKVVVAICTLNGNTLQRQPSGGTFFLPGPRTSDHVGQCILRVVQIMTIKSMIIDDDHSDDENEDFYTYSIKLEHVTWSNPRQLYHQCTVH